MKNLMFLIVLLVGAESFSFSQSLMIKTNEGWKTVNFSTHDYQSITIIPSGDGSLITGIVLNSDSTKKFLTPTQGNAAYLPIASPTATGTTTNAKLQVGALSTGKRALIDSIAVYGTSDSLGIWVAGQALVVRRINVH
jgi:hypothetical protein